MLPLSRSSFLSLRRLRTVPGWVASLVVGCGLLVGSASARAQTADAGVPEPGALDDGGAAPSPDAADAAGAPATTAVGDAGAMPGTLSVSPPPAQAQAAPSPTAPTPDSPVVAKKKKKKAEAEASRVEIGGRVYALFATSDRSDRPENELRIASALVEVEWKPSSAIHGEVSMELSRFDEEDGASGLRDAFIRVSPWRALRIQAGQFKKPFSRAELIRRRDLPFVRRGLIKDWLMGTLLHAGRDIGVRVDGRWGDKVELRYAFGLFNGDGPNRRESDLGGAKDAVGRIELAAGRWLEVAVDASYRTARSPQTTGSWAFGVDAQSRLGPVTLLGEVTSATDTTQMNRPRSVGGLLWVWADIPVTPSLTLQPVAAGELLAPRSQGGGQVRRGVLGVNAVIKPKLRVMANYEVLGRDDILSARWTPSQRLLIQLALDV